MKPAALIAWDMQNAIAKNAFDFEEIRKNTAKLIDAAHQTKRPMFFNQHTNLPFEYTTALMRYSSYSRGIGPRSQVFMQRGSEDWRIVDGLQPAPGDIVLEKHTQSFFVGTSPEPMARAGSLKTLMNTGAATKMVVETTAMHADALGFYPLTVCDAVGSCSREHHEASLKMLSTMFPSYNTEPVYSMFHSGEL